MALPIGAIRLPDPDPALSGTGGGPGRRLAAPDYGDVGKTLDLVVLDHVIRHAASEGPFLDLAIHRKGRQGLRWHSS